MQSLRWWCYIQLALAGVGREEFSVSHTMQCVIALKTLWKRNRLGPYGPLLWPEMRVSIERAGFFHIFIEAGLA